MYKLTVLMIAVAVAAALPLQHVKLAKYIASSSSQPDTDIGRSYNIQHERRAGLKSQSEKEMIQELSAILSNSQTNNKKGQEQVSVKQSIDNTTESQSDEVSLKKTIKGLLETESKSQQTTAVIQHRRCLLTEITVNDIKTGRSQEYVVVNNNVLSHPLYIPSNNIVWINTYLRIRNEVKSNRRNRVREVWFAYTPTYDAIDILSNIVFEDYNTKPTLYIAHLTPLNATLNNTLRSISCIQSLVNEGYTIKEWDWNIFSRLTDTRECDYYAKDSTRDTNLEHKIFERYYLNKIKPNNNLGTLCSAGY